MPKQAKVISLSARAEALRKDRGDNVALDEITSVVGSLMAGNSPGEDVSQIVGELRDLLDFIGSAKSELMAMQPNSLTKRDIPSAHDQLDAIIDSTEGAASVIMDTADALEEISTELGETPQAERLSNLSIELFQASSFQDLTGQRITKVTTTLMQLESRLSSLAEAIGDQFVEPDEEEIIERDEDGVVKDHKDLLNGPQLEGEGNSQAEIDALLASFD